MRATMLSPLCAVVAGLLAGPALAAEPIGVGSPALHCAPEPYENAWTWKVVLADGKVRPQGVWSDQLQRTTLDGRDVLRRVQGMTYLNGQHMTLLTLMDPATCAPIRMERRGIDGRVLRRRFENGQMVTERVDAGGATKTTTTALKGPVFDFNDGGDGLLIAALPLKVGYEATVASMDEMTSSDSEKPVSLKVLREETVKNLRGQPTKAFVVESEDPGQSTAWYWVSKAPPYYLRLEMEFPDHRMKYVFDQI